MEGKPGSGKSILMRFIQITLDAAGPARELLSQWAHGNSCIILSFYLFRPSKARLAKTFEGLWRSLCFQLLSLDGHLVLKAGQDKKAPESLRMALTGSRPLPKIRRTVQLEEWFFYLLSECSLHVVVMVDGLDGFQEHEEGDLGHQALLHAIEAIGDTDRNRVKIICSSRPDEPFISAFRSAQSVKLHDVNFADIEEFARGKLIDTRAYSLTKEICYRADGVFLWAHIVVNDLAKAAKRGASTEELEMRIQLCPDEMHSLYRHMLKRQDKFYVKHPEPILPLVLLAAKKNFFPLTLFHLLLLSVSRYSSATLLENLQDEFSASFISSMNERSAGFEEELVDRCGGLVSIRYSL